MRTRWAVPAALAVVLACAPARAELRARTRDLGAVSPVVSLIAWDKGGSQDWGAGIPSPTIDCAVGSSLSCTGAVPTYVGLGETVVLSPFWYRGDVSTRNAVRVSSSDFYRLGDTPRSGSFTEVFAFRPVLTATYIYLISKGGDAGFIARINSAGTVQIYVNGATAISCGAVTSGSWYVLTYAYERLTEGTSRIRCSLNGSAGTEVTNAGLLVASGTDLLLTDREDAPPTGHPFSGDLRKYSRFDGFAASAAQLAQLVATQWGLAADKPSGTVATHARSDSTYCGPFSDAELYLLGPGAPCIHAPTYAGWASGGAVAGGIEVYGAGANLLAYSTPGTGWTLASTPAPNTPEVLAPDGTQTATKLTANAAGESNYQGVSTGGATSLSVWVRAGTLGAITLADVGVSHSCVVNLATGIATPAGSGTACSVSGAAGGWLRATLTTPANPGLFNLYVTGAAVGQTFYAWGAQATQTAHPVPYRSTTGTAYAGSASTATTLTVPVALTDPSRWAISFTGTPTGAWQLARGAWTLGTYGSANSAAAYFTTGQAVIRVQGSGDAYWQFTPPATVSDTHTLLTEYVAGAVSLRDNGAPVSLSFAGAPTGSWTMPSTLTVGTVSGQFNGLVARVAQGKRAGGLR